MDWGSLQSLYSSVLFQGLWIQVYSSVFIIVVYLLMAAYRYSTARDLIGGTTTKFETYDSTDRSSWYVTLRGYFSGEVDSESEEPVVTNPIPKESHPLGLLIDLMAFNVTLLVVLVSWPLTLLLVVCLVPMTLCRKHYMKKRRFIERLKGGEGE